MTRNDNSGYLLTELIRIQDINGKTDAFWNVRELLKPYLLALSSKPQGSFDDRHPYGLDKVIISYLFGNSPWRSGVHRCAFLPEGKAAFFDDFIDKSGSPKALFYTISRLLYTVGQEPYIENGINWSINWSRVILTASYRFISKPCIIWKSTSVFLYHAIAWISGTMWNWL